MRYFREQGKSDHEVIEALNAKFGDNYQIMSRKMVKLGGIFGVGRRNGVEYFGYILEKATSVAGSNRLSRNNAQKINEQREDQLLGSSKLSASYADHEYYPVSEKNLAERDQHSRDQILERFAKNKKVQQLLRDKKLVDDVGPKQGSAALPPAPYFESPAQSGFNPKQPASGSPLETQANHTGFTSIYNPPAAKPHDPEQASLNYDMLAQPPHSQNSGGRAHNQQPNYEEFTPPQNMDLYWQRRESGQNTARMNLPKENFGENSGKNLRGMQNLSGRQEGYAAQHQNPMSPDTPVSQIPSQSMAHSPYTANVPNSAASGGTTYSSNSSSPYQNNLDQMEATFLRRLDSLERKLDRRGSMSEPASLTKLRESMYHNEFPPLFVDRLVSQMKRELPLDELEKLEVLWEYVLLHIAENMRFIDFQQQSHSRITVLVGPTGVGKTTTIAKLAARQCVEAMGGKKKVHLITLDNYRIGAQDQIRTYGEILGARVDCVETTEGLATCIAQDQESDMILIDTMGRSPSDHMKLAEMRNFLQHGGNCEIHLTMSATSGASSLKEIITQFKPFGFRSVILTKLDEIGRIGGALGTFLQEEIVLSYVTTGQKVPQDIRPASALVLFQQLTDVQVNWQSFSQKLEENIL